MMEFLRKHKVLIYSITIIGFFGGIFVGFGGYLFGPASTFQTVAVVNGAQIPYKHFTGLLERELAAIRNDQTELTEQRIQEEKTKLLQRLIQEELLVQQAKKLGITVTDRELAFNIQSYPAFQTDGRFDRNQYVRVIAQQLRVTPEEFEEEERRRLVSAKVREFIAEQASVSQKDAETAYEIAYSTRTAEKNREIAQQSVPDEELQNAYKKDHNGSLDDFTRNRSSYLHTYKQTKHRDTFIRSYRQKIVSQFFSDWAQKLQSETKVKVHLDKIEKLTQQG